MKKIKRVGRINPRGQVKFFVDKLDLYEKLRDGETIEVPDHVFNELKGVKETKETIVSDFKTYSKPKKKKSIKSSTKPQHTVDAEEIEKGLRPEPSDEGLNLKEEFKSFQTKDE